MSYTDIDLRYQIRGEFTIGPDGDFATTQHPTDPYKSLSQEIVKRAVGSTGDYSLRYPPPVADLYKLMGLQNTRDTAMSGVRKIVVALTSDRMISERDLQVIPIPTSRHDLMFTIIVKVRDRTLTVPVGLNLQSGAVVDMR